MFLVSENSGDGLCVKSDPSHLSSFAVAVVRRAVAFSPSLVFLSSHRPADSPHIHLKKMKIHLIFPVPYMALLRTASYITVQTMNWSYTTDVTLVCGWEKQQRGDSVCTVQARDIASVRDLACVHVCCATAWDNNSNFSGYLKIAFGQAPCVGNAMWGDFSFFRNPIVDSSRLNSISSQNVMPGHVQTKLYCSFQN